MPATKRGRADADRRLVLQAWLGTRLVFAIVLVALAVTSGLRVTAMLGNWDVAHFAAIARDGYAIEQDMAFFPGLPLLMRVFLTVGVQPEVSGVVLALVGSALATLALLRLGGPFAATAWLLAPTGVFTTVGYTESPFCAAAFWAWERATNHRWLQAALLAAVACTFRVSGLFLVGALAVLAITTAGRAGVGRALASLLIPTAVLAAYVVYLYSLTGSWTAWFTAQAAGWEREFTWPWEAFMNSWRSLQPGMYPDHPEWVWIFRGEMIAWILGLVTTFVLMVKRRWGEASWIGVQVLAFSLSYWFQSVNRAVLLWFPLWILIGHFVERRQTRNWSLVWTAVALLALALQIVWAWLFFTGKWAS